MPGQPSHQIPRQKLPLAGYSETHGAVIRSNTLDGRTSGAGSPFIAITNPYLLIHKPLIEHLPYTVERKKEEFFFLEELISLDFNARKRHAN